jgi:hypothetical protein
MTAVMRPADACLSASMVISSSMMPSETGGHEVWMTKTSASRTFSWIWTSMFSLEKRTMRVLHRATPICRQICSAKSGCDEPAMMRMSLLAMLLPPSRNGRI